MPNAALGQYAGNAHMTSVSLIRARGAQRSDQ
jgi:hypothetical protein